MIRDGVTGCIARPWKPMARLMWRGSRVDQGAAVRVMVALDTAPTSAGDIEIVFDSADGDNYDTIVEKSDPSTDGGVTDLVFLSGNAMPLLKGDAVRVKYTNPDTRRVNVTILGSDDFV